jgi:hypothetical protein
VTCCIHDSQSRAAIEFDIEMGFDVETRQMGNRAECDLCDEVIDFDRAIPNGAGEAYRRCWAEAYGAPDWFADHA